MISLSKTSSLSYYIEDEGDELITKTKAIDIVCCGSLANELGITAKMQVKELENIFNGFDKSGNSLIKNAGDKNHIKGWDLTFSAPKPVSIAWARASSDLKASIRNAHHLAVTESIKFLEENAAYTRVKQGGKCKEKTNGFAAIVFEHYRSRADEMQLHSHVLIPNLLLRNNTDWSTIDSRVLFSWVKATTQIYRALLATSLRKIGFGIERFQESNCFTLSGVPLDVCKFFSSRSKEIRCKTEELGLEAASTKTKNKIAIYSRLPKTNINLSSLTLKWKSQMSQLGYEEIALTNGLSVDPALLSEPLPILQLIKKLTLTKAVIYEQQIYECVATEAQFYQISLEDILDTVDEILKHKKVLKSKELITGKQIFTTSFMLNMENELLNLAIELRNHNYELKPNLINFAILKQEAEQKFSFSDEQKLAIKEVCKTGLDILQGRAGAGKSTSMKAIRIAYESANYKVIGVTIAKKAAIQLEEDTGIKSSTLASLLKNMKRNINHFKKTVIVADEAGLVPSIDFLELFKNLKASNSKLVLVGETEQLSAITHTGCLAYFSKIFAFGELHTIYRQREKWARDLVTDLRMANSFKAIDTLKEKQLLHIADSQEDAQKYLIKEWESFMKSNPEKKWAILANSWKDAHPLNELVRVKLQKIGIIGAEDINTNCVVSEKYLTLSFSINDHVRFTRNNYQKNLINGETGTIKEIEEINGDIFFAIQKDSGEIVKFLKSEYEDKNNALMLVHAYVTTVYSAQGMTIEGDTFIMYDTYMGRAATYVAGSRHKRNCHWFVNGSKLDQLIESLYEKENICRLNMLAKCMSNELGSGMAIENNNWS